MFDIGWGEFLVIGIVALIAIGPKELPSVLRTVGQWVTRLRRMASEFQGQFQEAIREAEMADLKKEVDEMTAKATSYANFDPIGDIRREIESTVSDKPATEPAAGSAAAEPPAAGAATEPAAPSTQAPPPVEAAPAAPKTASDPQPASAAAAAGDWPEPATFRESAPKAGGKSA